MNTPSPVDTLRRALRGQIEELRQVPLRAFASAEASAAVAFDEEALARLLLHRQRIAPHLRAGAAELGRLAADSATRFGRQLRERNQYVTWNDMAQEQLTKLFSAYYRRLGDVLETAGSVEDLREHLVPVDEGHLGRLARFVQSLWRDGAGETETVALSDTIASEYSVALQFEVLGLDSLTLRSPVLDVGCGTSALLVHHLRNLGFEAYGLERSPTQAPFVRVGDWLQTDFGANRWGTVIAHLSFTNHFVLHHGTSEETAGEYAQTYLRLLHSLVPGGSFHYAPGVPFIESFLPAEEYSVTRREILPGPADTEIEAVRIVRLR
ncbi:MAG: class I SAM-dependent methyltransferase [Polyangiaceae bacterium]|nr:class I SAM-dependent methyltransferase [Polyangiaceae bacterium]